MHRKIAFSVLLLTMLLANVMLALPVVAMDFTGELAPHERQIVVPGILYDEMFPEYNHTYWQKNSLTLGFTAYGETVTDQDPLGAGSDYGVGLTYPSVPVDDDGSGAAYVTEHIACPSISGPPSPGGLIYIPVEGWQLFWRWQAGTPGFAIDPSWHISMAIYGNHSAPYGTRARLDVKLPEELGLGQGSHIITNTSRLFALHTHFYTYNETLLTDLGLDPTVFEIELIYVFFKNTKKVVQFWTVQYLKSEYGAVDVVFRRLTDWSVDNKFQDFQNENFACFFPTGRDPLASVFSAPGNHPLWTGCDYWPQNYSLGLAWTNATIAHWDPDDAQHHVGFIAYYPNCSNWDTDNWNWYLTNLWTEWPKDAPLNYIWRDPNRASIEDMAYPPGATETTTGPGPLTVRYSGQPNTYELDTYPDPVDGVTRFAASPLMMGQWNFTLTAATAQRMAKFVNVMGVTNCSDTFGYHTNPQDWPGLGHYSWDWDSDDSLFGGRTISEIKYLLAECFNSTYKLSSEWFDIYGNPLDISSWFPFSGVTWEGLEFIWPVYQPWSPWAENWIKKSVGTPVMGHWPGWSDPRNSTFLYGESVAHNGMVFTSEAASVVDVVGGTEVGMDFGSFVGPPTGFPRGDPWFEAMWDTSDFMGGIPGPFVPEVAAPDFFFEETMLTYLDPLPAYSPVGPIETDLTLTAIRRMSNRRGDGIDCGLWDINYFTTPTGFGWNLSHIVSVGGPKVNLGTEYFNEHTWAVWTSAESGCEFAELADGGIYVFTSGNKYPASEGGYSVITIAEDLNLTSWTAIYDEEFIYDHECGWMWYNTDPAPLGTFLDGPTFVDPYAGLLIWGMSGWDTRAAANWFAQYRVNFNNLFTNATFPKRGVTTIILRTDRVDDCVDQGWEWGIKEILGPVAGRWRLSPTAWSVWIAVPVSIQW